MELQESIFTFLLAAVLYGSTMKIADLLDEHGLKWFRFAPLLFGILWGMFGGLLIVMGTTEFANAILAMNIAFIFRMRIDYKNHAVAVTIILITFLVFGELDLFVFFLFFLTFILFGSIKDHLGEKPDSSNWAYRVSEFGWYYILPPFIYALWSGHWSVFTGLTAYILAYNATRYVFSLQKQTHPNQE
jgi:hypothetical protein